MYWGSRDLLKFCEITDNISETVQNRGIVEIEDQQEIVYVTYRMTQMQVILSDLEVTFVV